MIRSRREREEPPTAPAPGAAPRPAAVKPIPMPATRVHVMDPKGFNDAQEVGDRLKAGQPVILNLQGVDRDLQRRLIDFSSGLAYALNGTMSKAADQVFLLTPSNVEVSEEEKERLQARGLYRAASRRDVQFSARSSRSYIVVLFAARDPVVVPDPAGHAGRVDLPDPARSHRAGARAAAPDHPAGGDVRPLVHRVRHLRVRSSLRRRGRSARR